MLRLTAASALTILLGSATSVAAQQPAAPETPRPSAIRALSLLQDLQIINARQLAPAINGLLSDTTSHMHMAERRRATTADSARARQIVATSRAALSRYTDVSVAEQEGYVKFMPWLDEQDMYHYNNIQNVFTSISSFDAAKPSSLLYRKENGKMVLLGAMYTALPGSTPDDLDARLPLGVAHWHEHVNFCGPKAHGVRDAKQVDGAEVAKWLAITSREECTAAGGQFVPRLFGWMAHVYMFGGDDPLTIWGGEHADHMQMHH
ncbi:MAG: hypothetical protein M3Z05_18905 [Gemmatimonadota bacterium]|nr:hypothetical protein [Gemmatimonadota bacterium]